MFYQLKQMIRRTLGQRPVAAHAASFGAQGEKLAADFLRRELGVKILARNARTPRGELDIVALDGSDLVFVEVRTRGTEAFGVPEKTIRNRKRALVIRAAKWFIASRRLHELNPRFDTVAVVWEKNRKPVVRHTRNAFSMRGR